MLPPSLLTGVETAPLDLAAQAALVAAGGLYLAARRRLARRGRPVPARRAVAFLAGLAAVWVAVGSDLARYDDTNVTVHVVQHLLLMMVAPPLLVLGRPVVIAMQAAGRGAQVRLAGILSSRPARWASSLVATWVVYFVSMWLMLADRGVYGYLIAHPLVHDASHAWLVAVGVLYWEPLLGAVSSGRRVSPPAKVIAVLATMPFEVLIGLWLRFQAAPLAPVNTVADTQRAGEAFVVGATLVSTVWLVAIVGQWAAAAIREERRAERLPPSAEWTTPWWVAPSEVNGASGGS